MNYQDPNPENRTFVEEVQRREHFNNFHCHLPGDYYREGYEESKARGRNPPYYASSVPIWKDMDEFIAQTNFDVKQFRKDFDEGAIVPELREKSQIALCPLYVFLRKRGFTSTELCS